tara:strand:+ start:35 stop:457 length:423 start_codon:yes stop_codon:yes gene_type:complete
MMKKHYEFGGTPEEVQMPMEFSGMMVDRKPSTVTRESSGFSGIELDPPKVAPRPAPPEFTINPPSYPPQEPPQAPPGFHKMPNGTIMRDSAHGIGSIAAPKTSRKLGGMTSAALYLGGFAGLAYVTYKAASYLYDEEDDE